MLSLVKPTKNTRILQKNEDESNEREYRICSICGAIMYVGYIIGEGEEYYCSDNCLRKDYTEEEYSEMYENNNAYWTEWE